MSMKNAYLIVFLTYGMLANASEVSDEASQNIAVSQEPNEGEILKTAAQERGLAGLIEILPQLPVLIYDLPLDLLQVTVNGQETSIGEMIGSMNYEDPMQKGIMDAYFSHGGKRYLEKLVEQFSLEGVVAFLTRSPFVVDHLNPFNVVMQGSSYSLGYLVEVSILRGIPDAQRVKDMYQERKWNNYRQIAAADGNPEVEILDQEIKIDALIKALQKAGQEGIEPLNILLLLEEYKDIYELDWNRIAIENGTLFEVVRNEAIRKLPNTKTVYAKYLSGSHGKNYLKGVIRGAYTAKSFSALAEEVMLLGNTKINLFDPRLGSIGLMVEEHSSGGDESARKIRMHYTDNQWAAHKKTYEKAIHLQSCIKNGKLDDRACALLKAYAQNPDPLLKPVVEPIKVELARQAQLALAGADNGLIDYVTLWLQDFDQAGITLEGTESIKELQEKLILRKKALAQIQKAPVVGVKKPQEIEMKKLLALGVGVVMLCLGYDYLKQYFLSKKEPDKEAQGSIGVGALKVS